MRSVNKGLKLTYTLELYFRTSELIMSESQAPFAIVAEPDRPEDRSERAQVSLEGDPESQSDEDSHISPQEADAAVNSFIQDHAQSPPAVEPTSPRARLPSPVVIPQRRPGSRSRGFVKAYAPVLELFGIDRGSFSDFIQAANKAFEASKFLVAVQLAATGTSFVPNSIALGASIGVQVLAAVIAKAEANWKYAPTILLSLTVLG